MSIEIDVLDAGGTAIGDIYTPRPTPTLPPIVLLHGCNGIKEDFTQFAHALASAGAPVCNAFWRCARTGDNVDSSVIDIRRVISAAYSRWGRPVTAVAWSDAALPALVAFLDGSAAGLAGMVGISGFYGWASSDIPAPLINDRTVRYFGAPSLVAQRWDSVNPYRLIGLGDTLNLELIVGEKDGRMDDARRFHRAATSFGYSAGLTIIPGAGPYEVVIPRHPFGQKTVRRIIKTARRWSM